MHRPIIIDRAHPHPAGRHIIYITTKEYVSGAPFNNRIFDEPSQPFCIIYTVIILPYPGDCLHYCIITGKLLVMGKSLIGRKLSDICDNHKVNRGSG